MNVYETTIKSLCESGNHRQIPTATTAEGIVDLSSNDYLGLASHPELQQEFMESGGAGIALGSSAARLLSGNQQEYSHLESLLDSLYGRDALLFNSGYHANTGMVSALASVPDTYILADRLVHASIIDGITLSRAPFSRFRHNDMGHLERIIASRENDFERILVLAESVYSMDGDSAPLLEMLDIKKRHPKVMLYIDEAHAFGVLGPGGLGLCQATGRGEEFDVVIGTFGKACCSMGAFAITSATLRDYTVNRSRSFIFSTALPPIQAAWSRFVVEKMLDMDTERSHLARLSDTLSRRLGLEYSSHILPYMTGDPVKAVELSQRLLRQGFKVLPIRTPTVPPGTDRLRISLSAAMKIEDINRFAECILSL
ncbi:MAG: 8-amino-7-oxononanoate synthase [Muribaculaceae bacterium]|nr:8-amino-7-oxononanoate synthase [Muribaculaceae bacterium]